MNDPHAHDDAYDGMDDLNAPFDSEGSATRSDADASQVFEDQHVFDRFVDGALDEEQQRALLASLDYRRDGWRRLALAFVEARAWQDDLGALLDSADGGRLVGTSALQTDAPRFAESSRRYLVLGLAMAASFLMAFSIGMIWRDGRPSASPPGETSEVVQVGQSSYEERGVTKPSDTTDRVRDKPTRILAEDVRPPNGLREFDPIELPVMTVAEGQADWENRRVPDLPDYLFEVLQELGHHVELQRSMVPIDLPDGRRVVIPVEQIEVRHEAEPAFL